MFSLRCLPFYKLPERVPLVILLSLHIVFAQSIDHACRVHRACDLQSRKAASEASSVPFCFSAGSPVQVLGLK